MPIEKESVDNHKVAEPDMSTVEDTEIIVAVQPEDLAGVYEQRAPIVDHETTKEETSAFLASEEVHNEQEVTYNEQEAICKEEETPDHDQDLQEMTIREEDVQEMTRQDEDAQEMIIKQEGAQEADELHDMDVQPLVEEDILAEVKVEELDDMAASLEPGAILEPGENDVLNGRGASVNGHKGNQKFRALCFQRKPEFEAGNHAAKRRVATEIVAVTTKVHGRFLKRKSDKGPWFALSTEKAILKACQVMRDFQRPDRVQLRELQAQNGTRKRQRTTESTPGVSQLQHLEHLPPINENPDGVHEHDVLSGRGAFVNGHSGNARFRTLAMERKPQFDAGNYSEKRALATEIVGMIRSLEPPGRFLKKITGAPKIPIDTWEGNIEGQWEELSDEKAIHKACQVMRDIARPDRAEGRRSKKKLNPEDTVGECIPKDDVVKESEFMVTDGDIKDSATMLTETTAEAAAVQEAVTATTEEILDKALDGPDVDKDKNEEEGDAVDPLVVAVASEIEV